MRSHFNRCYIPQFIIGTSLAECVDKVKELQSLQKKSKQFQVFKDPVINKITVFKKLQKPSRPISRDYSYPHYKHIYAENDDTEVLPDSPGLRIGREMTAILDYTDYNQSTVANYPKTLSNSENVFIRNFVLPRSTQTWPFLSTPNPMMNGYPFNICEPSPVHLVTNKALKIKAGKAIIHTSAKPRDLNFSKPQWTAVLDVPYNAMALMQPSPSSSPQPDEKSDRTNGVRNKILFARGGGFISRRPVNDQRQRDNDKEDNE